MEAMRANSNKDAQRHLLAHFSSAVLMRLRRKACSSRVLPISHSGVGRKGEMRMTEPSNQNMGKTEK